MQKYKIGSIHAVKPVDIERMQNKDKDLCYKCKADVTYTDYGLTDKNQIICFNCIGS